MNVLIVEDIEIVAKGIKEKITTSFGLHEETVNYFCFADEALLFLEENTPKIIIVDLAMDSVGLSQEDQVESKNARLTGWIFLKNYVFNGNLKDKLENTHCYIFSGYGPLFSSELGIVQTDGRINMGMINKKLSEIRRNVYFVPKSGTDGGASELINAIKKHSRELI